MSTSFQFHLKYHETIFVIQSSSVLSFEHRSLMSSNPPARQSFHKTLLVWTFPLQEKKRPISAFHLQKSNSSCFILWIHLIYQSCYSFNLFLVCKTSHTSKNFWTIKASTIARVRWGWQLIKDQFTSCKMLRNNQQPPVTLNYYSSESD